MFDAIDSLGLGDVVDGARRVALGVTVPQSIAFSGPAFLYACAATFVFASVWRERAGFARVAWIVAIPVVSLLSEVLQLADVLPGTFDVLDLVAYASGAVAGWLGASFVGDTRKVVEAL